MLKVAEPESTTHPPATPAFLITWWPYLAASLMAFIAKLPTINNSIIFIDEPIYLIEGSRITSLESFFFYFQNYLETKWPVSVLPSALALAISQPNAILITRIFGMLATIAAACLIIAISKRVFNHYFPGFFSLIMWCLYLNHNELTAAPLLENYQTSLILLAFWLYLKILPSLPKVNRNLFWVGCLLMVAALIKPPAILLVPVFMLGLILHAPKNPDDKLLARLQLKSQLMLLLGVITPFALLLFPYFLRAEALAGLKKNWLDISFGYTTAYGNKSSFLLRATNLFRFFGKFESTLLFLAIPLFFTPVLLRRQKWSAVYTNQVLILLIGLALFAGYTTGQTKDHYLIPILPFFMLFLGYCLLLLNQWLPTRRTRLLMAGCLTFGILMTNLFQFKYYVDLFSDNGKAYADLMPHVDKQALVDYIETHSKEGDYLFIYYHIPEIYWETNRKPATNDSIGTWLADFDEPLRVSETLAELKHDNPKIIVDLYIPRFFYADAKRLMELPGYDSFLAENYTCSTQIMAKATICERK